MLVSVILAAGKGTRMRSDLPKVLHRLLGTPLLGHVLDVVEGAASGAPLTQVVVVGHGREEVEKAFAGRGILWAFQKEQLGTAHAAHCGATQAARLLEKSPGALLIVVNGDLPLLRPATLAGLLERHRSASADVSILTCEKAEPTGYGRIVRDARGAVSEIVEEKDADEATRRLREINVGAYVFRPSLFLELYGRIGRSNAQGELYLTDVVIEAARAGKTVATFAAEDPREVGQVNSRSELARASEVLRERILEQLMSDGVTIDDPRTTYIETGVRIGQDTRILPFTVIQRGVEIGRGCEVGPFAHLRPGARLADGASVGNFVEIKNTSVGRGSKVRHLSYLGDGIVGEEVNIGAGTIFANYDGKAKHTTVVKDRAFVGSGTVLVAPVTVGVGAVTGAGAVLLKNQNVPDGGVVVGVPAKPLPKR